MHDVEWTVAQKQLILQQPKQDRKGAKDEGMIIPPQPSKNVAPSSEYSDLYQLLKLLDFTLLIFV